jgi:hypothetical protein
MKNILLAVLAFLIMLMPWSNRLINIQTRLTFDEDAVWSEVLNMARTNEQWRRAD